MGRCPEGVPHDVSSGEKNVMTTYLIFGVLMLVGGVCAWRQHVKEQRALRAYRQALRARLDAFTR